MANVGFISLGCPKNQVDCELMIAGAQELGLSVTTQIEDAEAIVINTCSFITEAIAESDSEIRGVKKFKDRGRCRVLVVAGCLPQYLTPARRLDYPWVDAWLTPDQPRELGPLLADLLSATPVIEVVGSSSAIEHAPLPTFLASAADGRVLSTPPSLAYVKIAEGCNHGCRFCIIPDLRGRYRSRQIADIATEVRGLVAQGIHEIVLVCQDSSYFGRDRGGYELPQLLRELCAIEGEFWLRVMYLHPEHITDELLSTWSELAPRLLPYFDVPLQHVEAEVLKAMGRSGGQATINALLAKLRAVHPETVVRTSLIVGYPGESEEHFQALADWVATGPVDWCGVFVYSELPEMASTSLPGKVSAEIKAARREQLLGLAVQAVEVRRSSLLGAELEVVFEAQQRVPGSAGRWQNNGRSWREAYQIDGSVLATTSSRIPLYNMARCRVVGVDGVDLIVSLVT